MSLTSDFFNGMEKRKKKKYDDDIAPIRTTPTLTGDDIAPAIAPTMAQRMTAPTVVTAPVVAPEKEWYDKIVKKPELFDDGYQAGDIAKTILGTTADFSMNVLTGVGNFAEGIGDTINYGVADIFERVGNKDLANALREETKKSLVQKLLGETTETVDKWSVLDELSDSAAQNLGILPVMGATGGVLGSAGVGAVGQKAATTGLMEISGIGSGMSEAYEGGATDEEARTYGLISGTADALSELIFGGLGKGINAVGFGKGLSSADDMLAKKISNMFSSQIAKNLTQYGIKAGAEGFEEVLSGVAQGIGKKITYMSEKDLNEILKDENLLEQFVVGSVTSAIAQSGDFITSAKTGTDFITGLTENEQKVVDKEVENRIAEREEKGEKVTNKDKAKIREKVLADLDKGYISIDTIESALGGETYKSYKDTLDNETALKEEFDTLNKMKQGDMTGEQIDKRAELKQQLEELKNNSKKTELKDKLSNDVFNLAKDSRLAESYNEKARRGKSFEADLSKYDTKQQEVIKKAVESGVLNNTNRTHEFVDMIAKISADKGVLFDFTNNEKLKNSGFALKGKTVNGYKTEDGNIALNMQSQKALESVVGHEITHILEGTELYSALQEAVKQYATTKGEYVNRMQSLRELYTDVYKGKDFDDKLRAELTADIVGDYLFSDSDFINNLSTEQPNLFKKIYNEIKYLCKVATAGSKEARELEKVKKAFDNAWKESEMAQKGTQYSIEKDVTVDMSEDERYNILKDKKIQPQEVEIDENFDIDFDYLENNIKSVVETSLWKKFKELNLIKTYKSVVVSDIEFDFTGKGFRKSLHSQENKYGGSKADFAKIALNMQKLLDNAVLIDVHTDKGKGTNKEKRGLSQVYVLMSAMREGNKIVPVQFEIQQYTNNDNRLYLAVALTKIETGVKGNTALENQVATSLLPISDISIGDLFSKINTKDRYFLKYIPDHFLSEELIEAKNRALEEDKVKYSKRQYSLSDSNGRELSTEQGEYFKESKIRDINGNLKVMYHGSPETFTVFDKKKARSGGTYGNGFYFTDSKSHAGTYGDSYEVYLNITNPLQNGTNDITKEQLRKFVEEIAENEDYGIENYGYGATIDSVVDSVYGKSDFGMLMDLNISCIGNMVEAVELFNEVNGTAYDGIVAPTETVAFRSEQIKNIDNKTPTSNPDIYLSLSEDGEQPTKNGRFYGKDMMLDLPIRKDIAKNATTTDLGDLPIRKDIAPTVSKTEKVEKKGETEEPIAKILTKEPEVKKKSQLWSKIKTNFIDKASPFESLALKTGNREVDAKYNSIRYADTKAQLLIGEGADGAKALNDIKAEVEKDGLTEKLYEYLYHKHNVDRMTLEDRYEDIPNKAVFGDGMTAELSQQIVDEYEANNPKLIEYANDIYNYNNYLRKLLVEGGVISQETADLWEEMYPHYVPVRRINSRGLNINVPLDSGRTGVNAPIKKAKGGNTDILPLFETMAQRTLQTYKAVAKNRFGVELKNTLGTTIESSEISLDEVIDSIDTHAELLQKGEFGSNPTFTVFENGEKVTFEITDEMYDAMKPTSEGLAYTNKVANTVSNAMRGVLTEYNPTFMLTNAIKDAQDVLINSQHAVKTYKNFPKAIKELASKGKWYTEYIQNGGADNTYFDKQTNTFNKEKSGLSKAIGFPLEKISTANNFIERLPRLAEYIASRESGRSIDVSMLDAARVTTNFSAGGDVTKFLNRNGATFLNASVQGAAQQVRNIREAKANGLKGWVQLATKVALAGLPAVLLNGLLWDDDEEYEELSDYVKQNYYVVAKMQDGKFVRIPKGRTMAVIQDAFTQVVNALTGDDEVDLNSFLDLAISNLAPNNPLDNNIIAPIMQVKENKTWYGDDLVPTRLQDVPDAEQYDESTDAISKWLGEKLNYSPYKINYLLNQYSGGLGDVFLPMLTPEAESGEGSFFTAPMKDKFSTDSVFNNQNTTDFYNVSDELTVNANSINATDEDVLKSKYFNSISTEIGELYKEKREIQNSNLSDDVKFKQVRSIQEQINGITKNALNTYENITINGKYANIGDRHYRLNDDGEWQKITDEQLEKQNEVIGILGITPAQYWGNKEEYDMKALYPEKYAVLQEQGISVADYKKKYEESVFMYTDDFSWASKNPEKYTLSKVVTNDVMKYKQYTSDLYNIKADKDSKGKSISGSRKKKVLAYINGLDIDYGAKCILLKSEYSSDNTYNKAIFEYIKGRSDITYDEKKTILEELGATIDSNGNVRW